MATNIFINSKVSIYVFEIPNNYTMMIDRYFLMSKVIIPLKPDDFSELQNFLETKEKVTI